MAEIGVALVTTYYSNYMPFLSCCIHTYIGWRYFLARMTGMESLSI